MNSNGSIFSYSASILQTPEKLISNTIFAASLAVVFGTLWLLGINSIKRRKLPPLAGDSTLTILSKIADSSNPFALYLYEVAKVHFYLSIFSLFSLFPRYYVIFKVYNHNNNTFSFFIDIRSSFPY
jgi:hypothetical protein